MDNPEQEHKKFLEQQLHWCKKQDRILKKIEMKLHEMKKAAQYVLEHEPTSLEIVQLNAQLNELKIEVHFLEKKLNSVIQ
ncbi:hypothetical protein J1P26_15165 [Neobacillus sp. MM2021_6]|uniref:hypothetical protein n=1 Tax=Bacillaceae TaxID=186817 RepID=UPI00140A2C40|nr:MULTISPECIES: hypothetical protein [Bacillaceae]MBO0961039.1 hypothetical protein [Neobacillus sp. MM2021_6]NHC21493.1 hypothetical protein [Bacillus sp. MM2020_4]